MLERIVATKREEVAVLEREAAALRRAAAAAAPARPFEAELRRSGEVALVAEVKRRSPSAGWIRRDAVAAEVAAGYAAAGAAAVSVLTDGPFFGGSLSDLEAVRAAVAVPVLRKDFVLAPVQLWQARASGADAALLIVRILEDSLLAELLALAAELGLGALVEVHDGAELERALAAGARVVGVNNRDLASFRTDLAVTERLAGVVPPDRVLVAESGIAGRADVARLGAAGADAVLVGETLMRRAAPGDAAAELVGVPKRPRGRVAAGR